jgi:hypothetical protein
VLTSREPELDVCAQGAVIGSQSGVSGACIMAMSAPHVTREGQMRIDLTRMTPKWHFTGKNRSWRIPPWMEKRETAIHGRDGARREGNQAIAAVLIRDVSAIWLQCSQGCRF